MAGLDIAAVATFSAQTIGAVVMAVLLFGFNRQYRKTYLLHWTFAWIAAAVLHAATGVAGAAKLPWLLLLAGVAGWLLIGWLLFGVSELVRRRPVRMIDERRILIALVIAGLVTSLGIAAGIRSVFAAIGFGIAGVTLWRARRRREGIGFVVLAAAFVVYALHAIVALVVQLPGYVEFLLQTLMGIGMVACLLEDEREAAELATVEIEHLAYHDAMTGLPNRPLFIDRLIVALAQAARGNHRLAVFFLDLDRFKDINDSLGHSTGDQMLKEVAERIRRCVRDGDTVARFGGDEFTLMIPRIENVEDAAKIAQKIIETLKIPFFINERELFVTTSIGISLFPNDGADPETLVRNADTAMYRAKDQGRDNYQLYAPAMNARALERLALENMLRKALSQKELVLYYQPLVAVDTRSIIGLEALIRWRHPELGLLSPAHFISVAEVSGLIIPIGEWVLRTACRQIKAWHRKLDHRISVSVNLSARQFQQPDLVEQIRRAIEESGIDPSCLELEITESNAMQNADNTIYTLRDLKALGVSIAMDDFGTGYSSLNYLKRFPIDTLKLDQTFVRDVTTDPSDAAIVSAVIAMAHSLDLTVIAEGVETEEQFAFLQAQQCDRVQGYLYSAPLSAEEFETYLIAQRAAVG
jgi:diguanylate cyclase (GGDEF)-like protein